MPPLARSPKLSRTSILILGGTSGIGFAIASLLATHDFPRRIILSSSNPSKLAAAKGRLGSLTDSTEILTIQSDLSDPDTVDDRIRSLLESATAPDRAKKLDHVIVTATGSSGASGSGSGAHGAKHSVQRALADIDIPTAMRLPSTKVYAPLALAKHVASSFRDGAGRCYMRAAEADGPCRSSLTFTSGSAGDYPLPDFTAGSIQCGALHSLTKATAKELGRNPSKALMGKGAGVRVNCVSPGAVQTEMWDAIPERAREGVLAGMGSAVPNGRVGMPKDVAESYLGLLRDWGVTGGIVESDGGQHLGGMDF